MKDITVMNQNGRLLVDSRDVSAMVEKEHRHLLRDIRNYIEVLAESKIGLSDFFLGGTYEDSTGRKLPRYLLTKQGCEMVGNKMTGEKGIVFTAKYVQAFNRMELELKPTCIEDLIIMQAQAMKDVKLQLEQVTTKATEAENKAVEVQQEVQAMRDIVALNPNSWRNEVNSLINKIARVRGATAQAYREVREESYKLLDQRAGAKLNIRLTNRRRKVLEETGSKSRVDKLTKVDVIADDKRLTEVYIAIVKEMAIKYKVA
ncbi:phage regulatory protein, rha family [Natronincola peptidivorans]|uniref:Phage regulatory protein, rha family n=1 Tax=Natronincola peptidivorans TaxID=426128 RepID=A0A1I0FEH9_9FIRM|nr:Rha family transcriptional regulator [Natronincola peptidivorans]SET56323.1 phage regulatory protein, rha family [Natronincola peptidivorans]